MGDIKLFENREKNGQILPATTIMNMRWFRRYQCTLPGANLKSIWVNQIKANKVVFF